MRPVISCLSMMVTLLAKLNPIKDKNENRKNGFIVFTSRKKKLRLF
jgi:hypothetical protein